MKQTNVFVINKPKNITSSQLIQELKNACKIKKIGHGGTLDPLATGVLVVGINHGTQYLQQQLNAQKQYLATIEFGFQTDTFDIEGTVINKATTNFIELSAIKRICDQWKSAPYLQKVPSYSAIKFQGRELYKYSREGIIVEAPTRMTELLDYEIIDFEYPILKIKLTVVKGFYVRSFANDLGIAVNSYATLIDLCRLQSGEYLLADALTPSEFIARYNAKRKL